MILDHVVRAEGGWVLHNTPGDRGGETYAGVSRVHNPDWPGWELIDAGDTESAELKGLAHDLYYKRYWLPLRLDDLLDLAGNEAAYEKLQAVALLVFSCAVVSGTGTAAKLVQMTAGAEADGVIGPETFAKWKEWMAEDKKRALFTVSFSLFQIQRFAVIVGKNSSQSKFLLGWINRVFNDWKSLPDMHETRH